MQNIRHCSGIFKQSMSPPPPPCSRFSSLYKNKASISFVCNLLLPSVNDKGYVHTKELFKNKLLNDLLSVNVCFVCLTQS